MEITIIISLINNLTTQLLNEVWTNYTQALSLHCSDAQGILENYIYQVHTQKPGPLPSPELAILAHENEDPEGVKDDEHGREMKSKKVAWNCQGSCRGSSTDDEQAI